MQYWCPAATRTHKSSKYAENNPINVSSCPRYVFKNYVWAAVKIHTSRRSRRASEMVRHISGDLLTVYDVKRQQMIKNNSQTCFGHYLLSPASATASSLYNTPPKKQHIASQPCVVLFITFKIPVRLFKKVQKTTIKIVWAARAARSAIMIPNNCSDIPNLQLRLSRKGGEDASSNGKTHTGASISEQLISRRLEAHASCCLQPLFIKGSSSRKQTKSEGVKAEGRRS